MAKISMYIHLSRETIPPFFEGCWEGPSGFYRAVDWEDYLSAILPCIVLQFIANPVAKKMIMSLVNGCNWSMKRRISTEDLAVIQRYILAIEMERSFLTSRVFTPNNHYLSHIPYMIEQMGPLRFISCRASERNIKTHTRNIRSASKPSENASNNIHPDSFHCLDPNDSNAPALWEPASSFVTLGNGTTCGGLNDDFVIKALQTCYSRLVDHVVHVDLENYDMLLAKRLWLRFFVISSALYRKHLHLDIRADNFVLFETFFFSRRNCWFVGEVLVYLSHSQNGVESFFAVVDVMKHHAIDDFDIPTVKKDPDHKHIAVINFKNIIRCVGLVRYSDDENEYHVIWQYAKFDKRIDGRPAGALNDLRNL